MARQTKIVAKIKALGAESHAWGVVVAGNGQPTWQTEMYTNADHKRSCLHTCHQLSKVTGWPVFIAHVDANGNQVGKLERSTSSK